jgi:hypothetical protein
MMRLIMVVSLSQQSIILMGRGQCTSKGLRWVQKVMLQAYTHEGNMRVKKNGIWARNI